MYEQLENMKRTALPMYDEVALKVAALTRSIKEEHLPFTIRLVQTEEELAKAVSVRHTAYSRHLPEFGEKLKQPEEQDFAPDTAVLLAESKLDGRPLGTARIQSNLLRPLNVEQSVILPEHVKSQKLVEVTRLGVDSGKIGRLVKEGLFKACVDYCRANNIDWLVATGRRPIDRQYQMLMFDDLFPEQGFIPLQHVGNIPHRVMGLPIPAAPHRFAAVDHPMTVFYFFTHHPDINVGGGTIPLLNDAPVGQPDHAMCM